MFAEDDSVSGQAATLACQPSYMSAWSDTSGTDPIQLRRLHPRTDTRVVVSTIEKHNATHICQHLMSRGPDLVSLHEGMLFSMY
jgi:hypothetical protein